LSPRGQAVVDAGLPAPRERAPREEGTPLPRSIGAPATRALREVGVTTLEQVTAYTAAELAAIHGVGPVAITRLREAMAERGLSYRGD
jgi:predicted flap endonuclease-1-like 5' DNA nuclease